MRPDMSDPKVRIAYLEEGLYLMEQRSNYFEKRAGIPRPCPRCGGEPWVFCAVENGKFAVVCNNPVGCPYETEQRETWQDAWREHEANCRNVEEQSDGPRETL